MANKVLKKHKARAQKIVADALDVPVKDIPDDAAANTWGQWDSLTHMRIVLALEADMTITLPLEKIMAISSLEDIGALVAEYSA